MKNKSKIFYLSYDGILDPLGLSQILPYLFLINTKYDLEVISFEKKNNLKNNDYNNIKKNFLNKNIKWRSFKYYTNNLFFINIVQIIFINFYITYKLIKNDYIFHLRSYIPFFYLYLPRKIKKIEYIFDMRGFWFQEKIDRRKWNSKSLILKFLQKYEENMLKFSKANLCLTDSSIHYLIIKYPEIRKNKYFKIRTGVDEKKFNHLIKKPNLDELIFCYLGTTDGAYDLEISLNIYLKFKIHWKNSKIKIITKDNADKIMSIINKLNINYNDYEIIDLNSDDVSSVLSKIDIGLFFLKENLSIIASFPTKIAEFFILNKPIICNNFNKDISEILSSDMGMIINSPDELTDRKINNFKDIIINNFNNKYCKKYAIENLTNSQIINTIFDSYK